MFYLNTVGCCDDMYVYCCVVFYDHSGLYSTPHGLCLHHPPSTWSGFVRHDYFVSSRRSREDGLEDLKLSTGQGARVSALLGAPAVAKQKKKPDNSDSLQVQVEPVKLSIKKAN